MLYSIVIFDSPREGDKEWDSASFFLFRLYYFIRRMPRNISDYKLFTNIIV